MKRFSPFLRSSENLMLSARAARIGPAQSGMTCVYRHTSGIKSPYELDSCIPARRIGAYARRLISWANITLTCAAGNCEMQQRLEIHANKIRILTHYRGFEIYSRFNGFRLVATNGLSATHLPSAQPTAHQSTEVTESASKEPTWLDSVILRSPPG